MAIDRIETTISGTLVSGRAHEGDDGRSAGLALRYADPPLHIAALRPADVGKRIAQDALRSRIDGHFHLAAVKAHRRAGGSLREKPHIEKLRRRLVDFSRLAKGF